MKPRKLCPCDRSRGRRRAEEVLHLRRVLVQIKEVIQGGVEVLKNNAIGCRKSSYTDADIDEVREDWASFVTIFVM
ncbi:hypothetical protein LXL04_029233 [Taraxacum kok-saghyz]